MTEAFYGTEVQAKISDAPYSRSSTPHPNPDFNKNTNYIPVNSLMTRVYNYIIFPDTTLAFRRLSVEDPRHSESF